jgi:hypothetical protein
MKTSERYTFFILGGAMVVAAAFVLRSVVPELVRYMRIRRM